MATLASGERVCVKVQRPDVRETFALDIMILTELAALIEAHIPESRRYDPAGIVREFERTSRREVDFAVEASHIAAFARNFADDPEVYILKVLTDYSTSKVLTTEFIDGIKISEVERLQAAKMDSAAIARAGARAVLRQIFEFGLFHADPHPGNLFVTCDGKIAPIDFGIVGRLTKRETADLAEVFIGMVEGDEQRLLGAMEKLRMLPAEADRREVLEDVMLLSDKYGSRRLGDIDVKDLFNEMMAFMRHHRVRVRTEFLLLGKALSIYEEVGRVLDPDFSIMEEAKPYVAKLLGKQQLLGKLLGERGRALGDAVSKLSSIPSDLANILALARQGRLKIEFEHMGLEKVTGEIEKASNRLSFSLLVAALIVASSTVLVRGADAPIYRALALAGFAVAGLVGLWLLINILRSGRV
jgi:ubiquinone biosynthesis protein